MVLHKDGYVDQPITLDPARDRKMLVKLERLNKPSKKEVKTAAATLPPPDPRRRPRRRPLPPPTKPVFVPAPTRSIDPVAAAVEHLAQNSAPGSKRVGGFYAGHGDDDGQHSDWWVTLEGGRCYDFVTTGGNGVERMYVYLWGPNGKRATDRREGSPGVVLHHCATVGGSYHFQAKLAGGKGEFRMGIYAK